MAISRIRLPSVPNKRGVVTMCTVLSRNSTQSKQAYKNEMVPPIGPFFYIFDLRDKNVLTPKPQFTSPPQPLYIYPLCLTLYITLYHTLSLANYIFSISTYIYIYIYSNYFDDFPPHAF